MKKFLLLNKQTYTFIKFILFTSINNIFFITFIDDKCDKNEYCGYVKRI